ncbi:hypothetical protein [Planctomicrobium sp. SH664]|uniref:hypothetical protein n=1 Tax=Planctomicrobium sp. SH664 TaxID=3448125 RepID=UPI003F5B9F77
MTKSKIWVSMAFLLSLATPALSADPVDIGSRRELFLDAELIDQLNGLSLKMHTPTLMPVTSPCPQMHYSTILHDNGKYRMYTRIYLDPKVDWSSHGWDVARRNEFTILIESRDGLRWESHPLGVMDVKGIPAGNAIIGTNEPLVVHNFTPFIDLRPGVTPDAKYKAIGGMHYQPQFKKFEKDFGPDGLYVFQSADGIHWKRIQETPVIPSTWGTFDSQNVAFWSTLENQYVCYFRTFVKGFRSISRTTSDDLLHWTTPVPTDANLPGEHLYTNGVFPYHRAPHIYVAMPTRFQAKRGATTDIMLMSSRGGNTFTRTFKEAYIRPGLGKDGWGNRSNYAALNVIPTSSSELSIYLAGNRRYTLRYDGFASLNAGSDEGEMVTRPLIFSGKELELNYSTSASGRLRIEIQDIDGKPLPGFELENCKPIVGDVIEGMAVWDSASGADVSSLTGKPVRLRIVMEDSDLYSFRFK